MPTPQFVLDLRAHIGHSLLWLPGTTAVVLREHEGRQQVLCARRADDGYWTAICGIVEPGEDPHRTAVREALEEAGVQIEVERLVWVAATRPKAYPNGDECCFLDHVFRCRLVSGEPRVADDESSAVGWFDVDELPTPMTDHQRRRIDVVVADPATVLLGARAGDEFLARAGSESVMVDESIPGDRTFPGKES